MSVIATHLDDLLTVLRAGADLRPHADTAASLRVQLASRLMDLWPNLAAAVRRLDDWHAEVLADFIAEANVVAAALDFPRGGRAPADADTRVG
jgi:hypothetical protein